MQLLKFSSAVETKSGYCKIRLKMQRLVPHPCAKCGQQQACRCPLVFSSREVSAAWQALLWYVSFLKKSVHAKFRSSAFLSFLAASSSRFRRCSSCLFWSSYCQVVVKAISSYPRSNTWNAIHAKNSRVPLKCLKKDLGVKVCESAII